MSINPKRCEALIKRFETRYPKSREQTRIVLFREKHGDYYYDASTTMKLAHAFLGVLNRKYKEGFWFSDTLTEDEKQMKLGSKKLPLTEKEQAFEILSHAKLNPLYAGLAAFDFLSERSSNEYEEFEFVYADVIDFDPNEVVQ